MTNDQIKTLYAEYVYRCSLGIVHTRAYDLRMQRYQISLGL